MRRFRATAAIASALRGMALAMAALPALAQSTSGTHLGKNLPPQAPRGADEHLVMPQFPGGWTEGATQPGTIEVTEYMPKGQSSATWSEKISIEVHHGTNTLPLDAFQRRALGQMRENCTGVIEGRLQSGVNNGFPSAFWTLGCKTEKRGAFGEVRYTKAIQGTDTLYLISRSWRTAAYPDGAPPLSSQQIEEAIGFLTSAVLCTAGPAHPCPAAGTARK